MLALRARHYEEASQFSVGVSPRRPSPITGTNFMAIAPSKLGSLVAAEGSSDDRLLRRLRELRLVRPDVTDADVVATFQAARDEDAAGGYSPFNSPHERVRVFLAPFLTAKGRRWAVPLQSVHRSRVGAALDALSDLWERLTSSSRRLTNR